MAEENFDAKKFIEEPADNGDNGSNGNNGSSDGNNGDNQKNENPDDTGNGAGDDNGAGGNSGNDDGEITWDAIEEANQQAEAKKREEEEKRKKDAEANETPEEKQKRLDAEAEAKKIEDEKNKNAGAGAGSSISEELYTELSVKKEDGDKAIVEKIKELKKKNEELEARLKPSPLDENITKLKDALKLEDRELYIKDLVLQGISEEDAKMIADKKQDVGDLIVEAVKIRNGIKSYIGKLETQKVEQNKNVGAMHDKDMAYSKDKLKEHIKSTKTMFGFNMAKDEAKLSSTQDNHYEYIVSGQFMRDLTKSESDLADIAWFTRHKETIKKAFITKGANAEKANFLKELRNVELPGNSRKVVVDNSGDFDARRFTAD